MTSPYDISLNGKGYMLVKDAKGRIASGAAREQASSPFTSHLSTGEKWQRETFTFEGGVGQRLFRAGYGKYRWGHNVDTRSGSLMRSAGTNRQAIVGIDHRVDLAENVGDYSFGATIPMIGVQFTVAAPTYYRSFGVLVRRDQALKYTTADTITVSIYNKDAGTGKPTTAVSGTIVSFSVNQPLNEGLPFPNRWRAGEYFWLTGSFAAPVQLAAGTYYLVVASANPYPTMYWAKDIKPAPYGRTATVSVYDTVLMQWTAPVTLPLPLFKLKPYTEIDREVTHFCNLRGVDNVRRVYAAMGPKVMSCEEDTNAWALAVAAPPMAPTFTAPVTSMVAFSGILYVGVGQDNSGAFGNYQTFDGTTASTTWATPGPSTGHVFHVHNNLIWKAYTDAASGNFALLSASISGGAWVGAVTVGDRGTPIMAMCTHDGVLYCVKAEGVYGVIYDSDTFPGGAGVPAVAMVIDLTSDIEVRAWAAAWHAGVFFPSSGGVYEYKSSILNNVWRLHVDDEADELPGVVYAKPWIWQGAAPTTRDLLLTAYSPYLGLGAVWCFDGNSWVPVLVDKWPGEICAGVHLSSLGGGRAQMYAGMGFAINRSYWPTWTANRSLDPRSRFHTLNPEGDTPAQEYMMDVRLPRVDGGRPDLKKDWGKVCIFSKNFGITLGGRMQFSYSIDGGAWTWLKAFDTSPWQERKFRASSYGYTLDSMLIFVEGSVGGNAYTAIIDQVDLCYQLLPDSNRQIQVWISAYRGHERRGSGRDPRTALLMRTDLMALIDPALTTEPVTYVDQFGVTRSVRVIGVTPQDMAWIQAGGRAQGFEPEVGFLVTMLDMTGETATGGLDSRIAWGPLGA